MKFYKKNSNFFIDIQIENLNAIQNIYVYFSKNSYIQYPKILKNSLYYIRQKRTLFKVIFKPQKSYFYCSDILYCNCVKIKYEVTYGEAIKNHSTILLYINSNLILTDLEKYENTNTLFYYEKTNKNLIFNFSVIQRLNWLINQIHSFLFKYFKDITFCKLRIIIHKEIKTFFNNEYILFNIEDFPFIEFDCMNFKNHIRLFIKNFFCCLLLKNNYEITDLLKGFAGLISLYIENYIFNDYNEIKQNIYLDYTGNKNKYSYIFFFIIIFFFRLDKTVLTLEYLSIIKKIFLSLNKTVNIPNLINTVEHMFGKKLENYIWAYLNSDYPRFCITIKEIPKYYTFNINIKIEQINGNWFTGFLNLESHELLGNFNYYVEVKNGFSNINYICQGRKTNVQKKKAEEMEFKKNFRFLVFKSSIKLPCVYEFNEPIKNSLMRLHEIEDVFYKKKSLLILIKQNNIPAFFKIKTLITSLFINIDKNNIYLLKEALLYLFNEKTFEINIYQRKKVVISVVTKTRYIEYALGIYRGFFDFKLIGETITDYKLPYLYTLRKMLLLRISYYYRKDNKNFYYSPENVTFLFKNIVDDFKFVNRMIFPDFIINLLDCFYNLKINDDLKIFFSLFIKNKCLKIISKSNRNYKLIFKKKLNILISNNWNVLRNILK